MVTVSGLDTPLFKKAIQSNKIQSRDFNISVSSDNKYLIFTPKKGKVVISASTKIDRLNQIARQYGKVNFDFFTTDVAEALSKYAENHARFMAYAQLINGQTMPFDISADIVDAAGNVIRREGQPTLLDVRAIPKQILSGQKPTEMELTNLARRIDNLDRIS